MRPTLQPQGILRRAPTSKNSAHLLIKFSGAKDALAWLSRELANTNLLPNVDGAIERPKELHFSLGFTYEGLKALDLPAPYLRIFGYRAPSFVAGASRKAAQLGDVGASAPECWHAGFKHNHVHAVLSIFGPNYRAVEEAVVQLRASVNEDDKTSPKSWGISIREATTPRSYPQRIIKEDKSGNEYDEVHFGYRDSITSVGFEEPNIKKKSFYTQFEAGEFLLGRKKSDGSNPWAFSDASEKLRTFFLDGSFGVLRKMEQDVDAFNRSVQTMAKSLNRVPTPDNIEYVKAKLCGRFSDGRLFDIHGVSPATEISIPNHADDLDGIRCPFGSHIRRMNPQGVGVAQNASRPLMRRGMPYGTTPGSDEKGLIGIFFCASIEEQFEHVVGNWADRLPMGFPGKTRSKDPLIGQHDFAESEFEVDASTKLKGLQTFVTTRGTVYAFYPSLKGLPLLLNKELWVKEKDEEDAWK